MKKGCLGCALLGGALVVIVAVMFGVAWVESRGAEETETTLAPEVPATPRPAVGGAVGPDVELGSPTFEPAPGSPPGLVRLEIRKAEVRVLPAAPGEPLRVEARYDEESHVLSENLASDEGGRWRYDVTFRGRGGGFVTALRQMFSGLSPRIVVYLPRDLPLDLEIDVGQGGGELELGGLDLRSGVIGASQGGFEITFSEPTRRPVENLRIETSMGGFTAERVGNASPSRLEVSTRMGGAEIDLRGRWIGDGEVEVESSMGGAAVYLPDDVNLDVVGAPVEGRDGLEAPTVRVRVEATWGEIEVVE